MGRKVVCLTGPEINDLLRGLEKLNRREKLLILIFLEAGLRAGEVRKMTNGDLFYNGNPVREVNVRASHGNIGELRAVPVSSRLHEAIADYYGWLKKNKVNPDPAAAVFTYRDNPEAISVRAMEFMIKKRTQNIIGRGIWPHALRHTFATQLMRKASIRVVQDLLGHRCLNSTYVYMHPNQNDLSEAIRATFG